MKGATGSHVLVMTLSETCSHKTCNSRIMGDFNWMLLDKTLHAHATGLQSVWNAQNGNAETGGNEDEETERGH